MRKWLLAATTLLAACATLPDVKPFADATAEVHRSVAAAGDAARGEVRAVAAHWTDEQRARLLAAEAKLGEAWAARDAATAACTDYADALADLAAAGRSGAEAAKGVASGVEGLLAKLGAPGVLPANAVEIVAKLYGVVAETRAADSMGKAVKAADPAIRGIADVLVKDLKDAEDVVALARGEVKRSLKDVSADGLDFRNAVLRRRAQIQRDYAAAAGDAAKDVRAATELGVTNSLLATTEPWHAQLDADLAAADARFDAELLLLAKTRAVIAAWADAHSALGPAIESGRRLDVRRLVALAQEIRDLVRKEQP